MSKHRAVAAFVLVIVSGSLAACDDGMMANMDDELEDLSRHQSELQLEMTEHHRQVLEAPDIAAVGRLEQVFAPMASGHAEAMVHRMRDMQEMCSAGGRRFDAGSMAGIMDRFRARLEEHRHRMATEGQMSAARLEEESFRDSALAMMLDMRRGQDDARGATSHYTCRMHRH